MTQEKKTRSLEEAQADIADSKARALSPPAALVDMRLVYHGREPTTLGQEALRAWMNDEKKEFFTALLRAEKEYRDFLKDALKAEVASVETGRGPAPLPNDEGTLKALDLIDKVLAEANAEKAA